MKKVVVFQYEDESLEYYEIGNKIREALVSSLSEYGYKLLPDDLYDPDWTIHVEKDEKEFVVVLGQIMFSSYRWCAFLEDSSNNLLNDIKIQEEINPIIQEMINNFQGVNNIVWYDDFSFLKPQ